MRRTSPRGFGIVAVGIGALAAVSLALVVPAGAGAAQIPPSTTSTTSTLKPTLIQTVCGKLPGLLQTVSDAGTQTDGALAAARATLDAKRLAMTVAMTDLATAVVNHLGALDTAAQHPRHRRAPQEQAGPLRRLRRGLEQGPHGGLRPRAATGLRRAAEDDDRQHPGQLLPVRGGKGRGGPEIVRLRGRGTGRASPPSHGDATPIRAPVAG